LIVVDASGLFALVNDREPAHEAVRLALEREPGTRLLSPFVLAELDYLLAKRAGVDVELTLLEDVRSGAYELAEFSVGDLALAIDVVRRYRDLRIGITDASIVVLAERYGTNRVLTLDERHFRALKLKRGKPFVVLPADA
jgi:uncharacterized protein